MLLTSKPYDTDAGTLFDDDAPAPLASPGAIDTAVTGNAGSAPGTTGATVTSADSGLVFVNTYGSGVTAAFKAAIITAENFFQENFTGSVTLNMSFNLASLGSQFSAQNFYYPLSHVSFASLTGALRSHATTPDQLAAVAALPTTDPTGGSGFSVPVGMARNLGLAAAGNGSGVDDSVTLNANMPWTFGADAVGALEHEISEGALGRIGGLGVQNDAWGPMDLFRYSAPGQHDDSGGQDALASYFSVDGNTLLTPFHNALSTTGIYDGQDFGDWASTVTGDAFGSSAPGAPGQMTSTDLAVMNVLGWTPVNPATPMAFSVNDTTTNAVSMSTGATYTGPVAGLQDELIDITSDNLNITSQVPNVFIETGAGLNAIDVSKANGNNVLDGSTGSCFMVGGTGDDTFYMDVRNATAPSCSTIVNFHSGDNATVWGVSPADFNLTLLNNQGAASALGLDFLFTAPGHVASSFILAGFTGADLANGRLSEIYGTTPSLSGLPGSPYLMVHAN